MKTIIEWIKDDPVEVIGGAMAWIGLGFILFMLTVIGA